MAESLPLRLTLLGTGSPMPSRERASSGFLIEAGRDRILWDFGPGCCDRLMAAGTAPTAITHVFLSHLHFDHVGELPRLLFHAWDRHGGIAALPRVFGPPGTRQMVERLFGPEGAFSADLGARTRHPRSLEIHQARGGALPRPWPEFQVEEIPPRGGFAGEGWQVSWLPVTHHQPYLDSVGFRIEADGHAIAYSSDVRLSVREGPSEAVVELARGADVLIHYLNAFDFDGGPGTNKADPVAEAAHRAGVRTLVTYHHGPAIDRPGSRERAIAALARGFEGTLVWGEDLMRFTPGRHAVTIERLPR